MTADDLMTAETRVAGPAGGVRGRLRELARRALWRFAPGFARRRGAAASVERLRDEFEHTSKRHSEQIERLEDLSRELVLAVESLRREIAGRESRDKC